MDIDGFRGELIENGRKKGKINIYKNEHYIGYYIGDIMYSRPHGKGTLYRKNNTIRYFGDFVNGKFEGKGTLKYKNGERYTGEFKNDNREGKGILYYSNDKMKYDGYFKEDKYDGEGIIYYENGTNYEGNFSKGEKTETTPKPKTVIGDQAKNNINVLINSFLAFGQPLGPLFGIHPKCDQCKHSTDDHLYVEGTTWQCKKCGNICTNEILR